ncbi:MAG: hypothetical protein H7039_11160 [Bryobacteraceae bacterium]|nr:hypothetical protein [Bryobacteraceae bacterium]
MNRWNRGDWELPRQHAKTKLEDAITAAERRDWPPNTSKAGRKWGNLLAIEAAGGLERFHTAAVDAAGADSHYGMIGGTEPLKGKNCCHGIGRSSSVGFGTAGLSSPAGRPGWRYDQAQY